jgi:hypothetical protein
MLIAACSSATKTSSFDKCAALPSDSIYAGLKPAYRPCGLTSQATAITPRATPNYVPAPGARMPACTSVELEFVVGDDGVVEGKTVHVLRTTNTEYAEAVMAVVPSWRYQPAMKDGTPVRQIVNDKATLQTQVVVSQKGSPPPTRGTPPTRTPTTC